LSFSIRTFDLAISPSLLKFYVQRLGADSPRSFLIFSASF
jgi:hypothetical protein